MDLGKIINRAELPVSENSFEPIPDGWYPVQVKSCEIKKNAEKGSEYLNFGFTVTGDNFAGRMVFGTITLRNRNETAEKIGAQQLGEIMGAVGLASVRNTDQFIGLTLDIKVKTEKSEGYDPKNVVKGYRASVGSIPPMPTAAKVEVKKTAAPWG